MTEEATNLSTTEAVARADHSRAVYARALLKMRDTITAVHDGLEDEGDRCYLGSTNHAELIHEAWHLADALHWDEILEDSQPKTQLAAVNLELQFAIEQLEAEKARLAEDLNALAQAEATYRYAHDILGAGHPKTGRAWDLMKRAGDKARANPSPPSGISREDEG